MADYYDQLEAQLADLTERGAHRRRLALRLPTVRIGTEMVAVAAAVLVVVAVSVAFLGLRSSRRPVHPTPAVGAMGKRAPVIHNYSQTRMPPPAGPLFCDADLQRPGSIPGLPTTPGGTVTVYSKPPTQSQFMISVKGLKPNQHGTAYAVWLIPEVQTTSGGYQLLRPVTLRLLGVIKPSVGPDGRLAVEGLLPTADTNGSSRMLITLQPNGTVKKPGRTILEGDVPL